MYICSHQRWRPHVCIGVIALSWWSLRGKAAMGAVSTHRSRQERKYTRHTLTGENLPTQQQKHMHTHTHMDTPTQRNTHSTQTLPPYLSYLTHLSSNLLLCFECSFDTWELRRRQRGDGGGLMRRSGSRWGGGREGAGKREDRGEVEEVVVERRTEKRGRKILKRCIYVCLSLCVCVYCVHGSNGHTLRREIEEGQQRAHPLLRARDWRWGEEEGGDEEEER